MNIKFLESDAVKKMRKFFISEKFMIIMFLLAALITVFHLEVPGVIIFIFIVSALLVICDDLLATTLPFLLVSLTAIKCNDSFHIFIKYIGFIVVILAALIFHFVYYRKKIVLGKALYPMIGVSVAVTLGGVGFLSLKEYFNLVSFYYVFGLGFGMVIIYILLTTYLNGERDYSVKEKFTDIMIYMGLFAVFMMIEFYAANINLVLETKHILYMQWRNNISTFLMLAMPFAAFKAVKKPSYIFLVLIYYLCMLLAGSRGGLIFGGIELVMTISILIGIDKRHRWTYIAIAMGILISVAFYFQDFYGFFSETINRLISGLMGISGSEKEVRLKLFARAFDDFNSNPIFGTGLAYMGNRDVHPSKEFALCWYHCEPLQIMASLGTLGIVAFAIQLMWRFYIFLKKKTVFNITILVSYIGLEMMSLVNPGVFCPVPYLFMVTMYLAIVEMVNKTDFTKDIASEINEEQQFEESDDLDDDIYDDDDETVKAKPLKRKACKTR